MLKSLLFWYLKEPRKLSYAEVCQKPPVQPLRELRTNITSPAKMEENCTHEKSGEKVHEKPEGRMKDFSAFRNNGPPRGTAGQIRDQRHQCGCRPSPQGASRRVGKEQYVPSRSPKENWSNFWKSELWLTEQRRRNGPAVKNPNMGKVDAEFTAQGLQCERAWKGVPVFISKWYNCWRIWLNINERDYNFCNYFVFNLQRGFCLK